MKGSCVGSQESVWAIILTLGWYLFCFYLCGDAYDCIGFARQGLVAGVFRASVRRECQTEPVPVGSETDPSLSKGEPMSDTGDAFMLKYLRKGEKAVQQLLGERSENM